MIKNRRDFWAGCLFVLFGVAYAWAASLHEVGWSSEMGSGSFPLVLAALLVVGILFRREFRSKSRASLSGAL